MAVMQRLRCSADCGAPEFDAMVNRRRVGRPPREKEKLFIVDRTPDKDGFSSIKEVKAVCERCMAAIGGRARKAVGIEEVRCFCPGNIREHVGRGAVFRDLRTGEVFEGGIIGMGKDAQTGEEVAALGVRNGDGRVFLAGHGCGESTDPKSVN